MHIINLTHSNLGPMSLPQVTRGPTLAPPPPPLPSPSSSLRRQAKPAWLRLRRGVSSHLRVFSGSEASSMWGRDPYLVANGGVAARHARARVCGHGDNTLAPWVRGRIWLRPFLLAFEARIVPLWGSVRHRATLGRTGSRGLERVWCGVGAAVLFCAGGAPLVVDDVYQRACSEGRLVHADPCLCVVLS